MSGQHVKLPKSSVVLCGKDARRPHDQLQQLWPGMHFSTRDETTAVYHGIETTAEEGAAKLWARKAEEIERLMDDDESVFVPRSIAGRIHLTRGRYIGKTAHVFRYHVPSEPDVASILDKLQARVKTSVMGNVNWVAAKTAMQRRQDGGIAMPHVRSEVEAAWADSVLQLLNGQPRPWKNFSRYQLRRVYGEVGRGTRMLTANYSFRKLVEVEPGAITEKMRQAFRVYGSLPRLVPAQAERDANGKNSEADEQRMRAAPTARTVAYHVEAHADNWANGIRPKMPKPHERSPSAAEAVRHTLTKHGSAWGLRLYTDPYRAATHVMRDAATAQPRCTGRIVAVVMEDCEGRWTRVDDAAARARARLTPTQTQCAEEARPVVLTGDESEQPRIPQDAIIAHIEVTTLAQTQRTAER